MRFRISFLPAFYTILIAGFAIALGVRIRHYSQSESTVDQPVAVGVQPAQRASGANASAPAPIDAPDAQPDGVAATTTLEQRERERRQRYEQLLRQPPSSRPASAPAAQQPVRAVAPPAPVKAPQKEQSLLSKIVTPIVNAFTGGPRPAAQAAATTTSDHRDPNPKDPNSDTTPPQLVAIDFTPPSIHDGEATVLAVTATDDLSGVASIAGNVISPSGALQGFALQREGDSNRYVGRLNVPKSAAEGVWHVNYLSLTDRANNTATFSYSQGSLPPTASFRVVSSNADNTPPTLRALWIDRASMKAGEKNTVFVQADDDKSGVNLISGVFLSPAKFARVGFGCRLPDNGDTWTCDFVPPANADCGDWQIEQIQLQDKANNMISVRRDNPIVAAVHLNVLGDQCDSRPPTVDGITLDRYSSAAPGTIVIRVTATDDISGVSSVSGHFVFTGQVSGNQPPKLWFACSSTDPQTWSGPIAVPDKAAVGVWRLEQLQVLDKANNLKIYTSADPVVANVAFKVQ